MCFGRANQRKKMKGLDNLMGKDISCVNSYIDEDTLPIKLLRDERVISSINDNKKIIPVHIQFIPTNKCNLECPSCSCANEDRDTEMSLFKAMEIIDICKDSGTRAVTITGCAPCLHPNINEIIEYFIKSGIEVGLVDNGLALDNISPGTLNKMAWCRISHADFRPFTEKYEEKLKEVIKSAPDVDWAFSYIVSKTPNIYGILRCINFANDHNFTYIRLVADLSNSEEIDMVRIKNIISAFETDDRLVIYQNRECPEQGGDCYVCFLKPVISAGYQVYNCCGVQSEELSLGSAFDLKDIIARSHIPVNGKICGACYNKKYNDVLGAMMKDLTHVNFV